MRRRSNLAKGTVQSVIICGGGRRGCCIDNSAIFALLSIDLHTVVVKGINNLLTCSLGGHFLSAWKVQHNRFFLPSIDYRHITLLLAFFKQLRK